MCENGFQHSLAKQFLQKKKTFCIEKILVQEKKTALLIHAGEINKRMKNVQTVCTKKMYFENVQRKVLCKKEKQKKNTTCRENVEVCFCRSSLANKS